MKYFIKFEMEEVKEEDVINLMIENEKLRQKIYDTRTEVKKQLQEQNQQNQEAPKIEKVSKPNKFKYTHIHISVIPPPFEM